MQSIRPTTIDKFHQYLLSAYISYCSEHGLDEDTKGFLNFLLDRDFISSSLVNRYVVSCEYRLLQCNDKRKTDKIKEIADLLNLSERHVWSLVKYDLEKKRKQQYSNNKKVELSTKEK